MRWLRSAFRGLFDWRNYAVLAAVALIVLLGFVVIDSSRGRERAFTALKLANQQQSDARAAASRRIDLLQQQIATLSTDAQANGGRISQLLSEVNALQEQVRQLGGRPVVTETATAATTRAAPTTAPTLSSSSAPSPGTTTTTTRPSPTTTTTQPPPSPATTCTTVAVLRLCR